MNSSTDKTWVLAFDSRAYPIPSCEEDEDTARQLAIAVRTQLMRLGHEPCSTKLSYGEGLWVFRINHDNTTVKVTLGVFPLAEDSSPRWALSFIPQKIALLCFRKVEGIGVDFRREVLNRMKTELHCSNLLWLSNDQFLRLL